MTNDEKKLETERPLSMFRQAFSEILSESGAKLPILGFGFFESWFFMGAMGGYLYPGANGVDAHFVRALVLVSLALGFALTRFFNPFRSGLQGNLRLLGLLGIVSSVASFALALSMQLPFGYAFALACSLVACIPMALVLMAGVDAWTELSPCATGLCLSASLVLACALFVAFAFLPPLVRSGAVSVLPSLCAFVLMRCPSVQQPPAPRHSFDLSRHGKRIGLYIFLFYFVFGATAGLVSLTNAESYLKGQEISFAFVFLGALAVFLLTRLATFSRWLVVLRKSYTLLFVCGLLCVMVLPFSWLAAAECFLLAGFVILDNLVWLLQPQVKIRSGGAAYVVFGKSRSIAYGALACGMVIGLIVNRSDWFSHEVMATAAAVLIVLVVCAQTVVLSEPMALELIDQSARNPEDPQSISERCDELADLAGLSEREREVMLLLARGMSYGHIEKELYISLNTVKSHASRLYRKLGVSSRQELIDLVQETN